MKRVLIPLLLLAIYIPAFAQEITYSAAPEITLHFGVLSSGSGNSIVKQMKNAGFGEKQSSKGFFAVPGRNPRREQGAVQVSGSIAFKNNYRLKGMFNFRESDIIGTAADYEPIRMATATSTAAALALRSVPVKSHFFRVGAGPSYHLTSTTLGYGETELVEKKFGRIGFVIEGGLSTPAHSRFLADLQVQYFHVGREEFGSHTLTGSNFQGNTVTRKVDFPKTSFSNFLVSLGFGFRFNKG